MVLLFISFAAGVLTVLAPCVLPLLPVIVGGSVSVGGDEGTSRRRAFTIALSLGVSVVIFTLLLKASTIFINVPPQVWPWISGGILIVFGIVMIFPRLWDRLSFVNFLNRGSNRLLATGYQQNSFWGDALMGAALGPVFASCSPTYFVILATVLPASFALGLIYLIAYALGLSGFLLVIALIGQRLADRLGVAIEPEGWFRRGIGALFLIVGLAVFTGAMHKFEAYLLDRGFDLTWIEQRLLEDGMPKEESLMCSDGKCAPTTTPNDVAQDVAKDEAPQPKPTPLESAAALTSMARKSAMYDKAPELVSPDGYVNTDGKPITIGEFRGKKVVLIDIWTYSCINCQRTIPYLRSWYEKYKDQGLEIIGVHTPEFAFEKLQRNVEDATRQFKVTWPVILDNNYATWNAFGNRFWPRKYLIDIDGFIVYDHAGEGNYEETEQAIQKALQERAIRLGMADMPKPEIVPPHDAVVVQQGAVKSPETYFGAWRNNNFGNGKMGVEGPQTLTIPASAEIIPNVFYLGGSWNFATEYTESTSAKAQLFFKYESKDVYFVAAAEKPVRIKVTRDGGKPLGEARGADVGADGYATIKEERLYKLIQDAGYGEHVLEITIEAPGLQAYTFTFG